MLNAGACFLTLSMQLHSVAGHFSPVRCLRKKNTGIWANFLDIILRNESACCQRSAAMSKVVCLCQDGFQNVLSKPFSEESHDRTRGVTRGHSRTGSMSSGTRVLGRVRRQIGEALERNWMTFKPNETRNSATCERRAQDSLLKPRSLRHGLRSSDASAEVGSGQCGPGQRLRLMRK